MAVIKEADLYIQTPEGHAHLNENALVSVVRNIQYNTSDLGLTCKIPLQVYQPLDRELNPKPYTLNKNNGMTPRLQPALSGLHTPSKFNKVSCNQTESWRTTNEPGISLPAQMANLIGLKHMPQDTIYTDSSSKEYPDVGQVTRSGIYRETAEATLEVTVRPYACTQGLLNTITRAELAALFVALQLCRPQEDEIIATDSKCSMDKIAKHLRNPALTKNDCHQVGINPC